MIIDLTTSQEFKLTLEPVDSSDVYPSVSFKVEATVSMPSWQATIEAKECWFSYESLNYFEKSLKHINGSSEGSASLVDLDGTPIIEITRLGNEISTRVTAKDSVNMGSSSVQINGYAPEIAQIIEKLRDYPKWW